MSARCPTTGSCTFVVVRQREMERKLPEEAFFKCSLAEGEVRLFIDSGSPARDIQRITATAALPGFKTILALVPKSPKQKRANSGTKAIKRMASLEDVTGALPLLTSDDPLLSPGRRLSSTALRIRSVELLENRGAEAGSTLDIPRLRTR
jgi:hypothetical protein